MQKLLMAAVLIGVGFYVYADYLGPGKSGFRTSSARSGGFSKISAAPRSVVSGVTGAAGRLGN